MVRRVVLPILAHFQEDLCGWTNRFLTSWQCSDPPLVESFHLASQAITTDSSSGPISSSEWESLLELLLEQAAELKKVHEKYSDVSMPKDDEEQAKSEEHGNAVHDEQRDEYILPTSGDECRGPPMETSEADGSVGYCFPETQITASSDALKAMNDCNSSEGILDSDGEKHSLSTSLSLTQNTISGMDLLEQAADALKSLKTINISDTLATPDFSPMPLGGGALQDLYTGHLSAKTPSPGSLLTSGGGPRSINPPSVPYLNVAPLSVSAPNEETSFSFIPPHSTCDAGASNKDQENPAVPFSISAVPSAVSLAQPLAVPSAVSLAQPLAVPSAVSLAQPLAVPSAVSLAQPLAVPSAVSLAQPLELDLPQRTSPDESQSQSDSCAPATLLLITHPPPSTPVATSFPTDTQPPDKQPVQTAATTKANFSCDICFRRFRRKETLEHHMSLHTDKRREHKCPICEKTYPAANKLRYHLKLHSQHPSFICEHCGKEFRRKDRLTAHEKIHSPNRKKSVCVHCGQQFLKSTSLREHLASKHGREEGSKFQTPQGPPGGADHGRASSSTGSRTLDIPMDEDKEASQTVSSQSKRFPCPHCDQAYTRQRNLSKHINAAHTSNTLSIPCVEPACHVMFADISAVKAHARKVHMRQKDRLCDKCGKAFGSASQLATHALSHRLNDLGPDAPEEVVRPHQCDICSKRFRQKGKLNEHRRAHVSAPRFECNVCGRGFHRNDVLTQHRILHLGARPFRCSTCGKRFKSRAQLKSHMNSHLGIQYPCPVCGKRFNHASSLKTHQSAHDKTLPFSCASCCKGFVRRDRYEAHLRTHTGNRPFVCPYSNCSKAYKEKRHLDRHCRDFHNQDLSQPLLPPSTSGAAADPSFNDHTTGASWDPQGPQGELTMTNLVPVDASSFQQFKYPNYEGSTAPQGFTEQTQQQQDVSFFHRE